MVENFDEMLDREDTNETEKEEEIVEEVKKENKVLGFIKRNGKKLAIGASGVAIGVGGMILKNKLTKDDGPDCVVVYSDYDSEVDEN